MKKLSPVIFALSLISGCNNSVESTKDSPAAVIQQPAKPALTPDERAKLIAGATKGFSLERDKMENISFYTVKAPANFKPELSGYLAVPDKSKPVFRVVFTYRGEKWVFFESVKVMADDQVVFERPFLRSEIARDNSAGLVLEYADIVGRPANIPSFEKIAQAKSVVVRFSGRERRHDHTLSKGEVTRFKKALEAYKSLATDL